MDLQEPARQNFQRLISNPYPGRGIVIGKIKDADEFVQIYWIMGRSPNSRNRIFVQEASGFVRTEVFDKSQPHDPSLIIYYALKHAGSNHVVTNGHQTDTITDALSRGKTFEQGLDPWQFEPDAPNYTPRIAGRVEITGETARYTLACLKCQANDPKYFTRQYFYYETAVDGYGHLITTYRGDGNPLPAFSGEPVLVPLAADIGRIADEYWAALNAENRVALAVKTINVRDNTFSIRIVNRFR